MLKMSRISEGILADWSPPPEALSLPFEELPAFGTAGRKLLI